MNKTSRATTEGKMVTLRVSGNSIPFVSPHPQLCFQEEPSEAWFPELQDLPSSVTHMDMRLTGYQRLTALGCQNGYLKCALIDVASNSKSDLALMLQYCENVITTTNYYCRCDQIVELKSC